MSLAKQSGLTPMQSILGSNYKWWKVYTNAIKSRTASFYDFLYFVLGQIIILAGTILIWWLAGGKQLDTNFQNKLTYFVIGEAFFCLIFMFPSFYGYEILRGNHTSFLLRPISLLKMVFFRYYGEAFLQSLSKFVFLIFLAIIFSNLINFTSLWFLTLALISLPTGLIILFLLEVTVSFSAFFLKTINGITLNFGYLSALFAGHTFPLDLLINNFYFHLFNPFAFTFYHPVKLYLGKYDSIQTVLVCISGITWCFFLYLLSKCILVLGLKRNEAVGL